MAEYLHGAYGDLGDSIVQNTTVVATAPVYIGTAPVNLVRDFADYDLINTPLEINSLTDARELLGDSTDWDSFTLCEAIAAHFDTAAQPVGPIYCINVLDPTAHRKSSNTNQTIGMANGTATFADDKAILDTITVSSVPADGETAVDYVENTDYTLDYNWTAHKIVIKAIDGGAMVDGNIKVAYREVQPGAVTAETIIGGETSNGEMSGIASVQLLYLEQFVVPNLIAAPGWSDTPDIYKALVKASDNINGHWDAFVVADIPLADTNGTYDTIAKAIAWKDSNGYKSERSAVCWPMVEDDAGRLFHLSTLYCVESMRIDNAHDGVPFETCSNKAIPVVSQYFGENSPNRGFDQTKANRLNAKGITTAIGWAGEWILWGPHTAAYEFGNPDMDVRSVFASNIRMLLHMTNDFQREWAPSIDGPLTRSMIDRILNREQEKLDSYVAQGALLGTPTIVFEATHNKLGEMREGNFRWDLAATPTPPLKSASIVLAYTDAGFSVLLGGE